MKRVAEEAEEGAWHAENEVKKPAAEIRTNLTGNAQPSALNPQP